MAWQRFTPEVIEKGFKKCCMSHALEGTDDDVLWNGSECEEDEGTDCEDWDSDTDW